MPKRLDSVSQGHYVEAIDVDERDLETVVAMLGIADAQKSNAARDRIYTRLEDLATARARTARPNLIRKDVRNLDQLAEVTDPERMTERMRRALDAFDSLRAGDPVLHQRLKSLLPGNQLRHRLTALQEAEEKIYVIGRELSETIAVLKNEIDSEDGRGRPPDHAGLAFASGLDAIWREITGKGTSRQNAPERQKDPFGDFVDAAGKLIDPDFNGHHLARNIHEARKKRPSGENEIDRMEPNPA